MKELVTDIVAIIGVYIGATLLARWRFFPSWLDFRRMSEGERWLRLGKVWAHVI